MTLRDQKTSRLSAEGKTLPRGPLAGMGLLCDKKSIDSAGTEIYNDSYWRLCDVANLMTGE